MSPSAFIARFEKVDIDLSVQVAIEETADDYTRLQRQQLSKGIKADGTNMPDYSPTSVKRGKPPGPIKLYDTGAFYQGILVDVRKEAIVVTSADSKIGILEDRYGTDILGHASQSKIEYKEVLQPEIVKEIKKSI